MGPTNLLSLVISYDKVRLAEASRIRMQVTPDAPLVQQL